jgi:hypothetical protein
MRITEPHQRRAWVIGHVLLALTACAMLLAGCQWFDHQRLLFDERGIRIGLETDPSVGRASRPTVNDHPANLTPREIQALLGAVRVTGWSGTVVGWFDQPRPIPLFDEAELQIIAKPIAEALQQGSPTERVVFSLSNPRSAYGDATTGALFLRHGALHLVVTDHTAFPRADTAGGDEKDPRDTKGMTLSLPRAYQAALVRRGDEPDWAPFERVHLSMQITEMLAHASRMTDEAKAIAPVGQSDKKSASAEMSEPDKISQELRLQIRELTQSNLDLRDRLNRQTKQLQELQQELKNLRRESESKKSKPAPAKKLPIP